MKLVLGFNPCYVVFFFHTCTCILIHFSSIIGYSILVVTGIFPSCEADELLSLIPIEPSKPTASTPSIKSSSTPESLHHEEDDSEDLSLAMAISASMAGNMNTI